MYCSKVLRGKFPVITYNNVQYTCLCMYAHSDYMVNPAIYTESWAWDQVLLDLGRKICSIASVM